MAYSVRRITSRITVIICWSLTKNQRPEIREHLKNFYLPEPLVKIRMFRLERKEKKRPPLKEEDKERLNQVAPPH